MTTRVANLTVQKWGNSFAVRIPIAIARSAHFHLGTPVELSAHGDSVVVKATGERKLSLNERLELFDPKKHSGEVMASKPVGLEKF